MSKRSVTFFGAVAVCVLLNTPNLGCTRSADAKRILEQSGYTNVEITGYRPFMAGNGDTFSTGFKAKAPNGQIVTGAVTGGWIKGSTIRLD